MCEKSAYDDRHLIWKFVRLVTACVLDGGYNFEELASKFEDAGFTAEDLDYLGLNWTLDAEGVKQKYEKMQDLQNEIDKSPTQRELHAFWECE